MDNSIIIMSRNTGKSEWVKRWKYATDGGEPGIIMGMDFTKEYTLTNERECGTLQQSTTLTRIMGMFGLVSEDKLNKKIEEVNQLKSSLYWAQHGKDTYKQDVGRLEKELKEVKQEAASLRDKLFDIEYASAPEFKLEPASVVGKYKLTRKYKNYGSMIGVRHVSYADVVDALLTEKEAHALIKHLTKGTIEVKE